MLRELSLHAMKYPDSVSGSRIQKYQRYMPLLRAYEKKSNSLRSDSAFFHTTQRFVPWVLLQILSSDTEPDISNMSDSQLKHICDSLHHIVNIKVLAGGTGRSLTCSRAFAAPRSGRGEELGFFIEHIESEALCRSLVSS